MDQVLHHVCTTLSLEHCSKILLGTDALEANDVVLWTFRVKIVQSASALTCFSRSCTCSWRRGGTSAALVSKDDSSITAAVRALCACRQQAGLGHL